MGSATQSAANAVVVDTTLTTLRQRRRLLDLTQAQVAEAAGVARRTIFDLEHGQTPMWPTAARVAAAVGSTPAELWPLHREEVAA